MINLNHFKIELEKQAGTFQTIGKATEKATKWMWHHPKTTAGAVVGAALTPKLLHVLFPTLIIKNQYKQTGIMDDQSKLLNNILSQEELQNHQDRPLIPMNRKIENPLV